MNIYIFEAQDGITGNWHDGGGVAIVANDPEQAQELMNGTRPKVLNFDEAIVYPLKGKHEARIFIFPDAGCC